MKENKPMTKCATKGVDSGLADLIKTDSGVAIGALIFVYNIGFTSSDADFMSSMARQYLARGSLSDKQIPYVKRGMQKYVDVLLQNGFDPTKQAVDFPKQAVDFPKQAVEKDKKIIIQFKFPQGDKRFFETVNNVKSLPERRFVKSKSRWECPISIEAVEKLTEWNFDVSSSLIEWHKKITSAPKINSNLEIPGFQKELYPFQKEGVSFVESRNGRALISDSMGLGKTIQALAYCQLHYELQPVIVICPASLKINWANEIQKGMQPGTTVHIVSGKTSYPLLPCANIIIINYDILSAWTSILKALTPKIIILDESHYLASSKTIRTKATIKICKNIPHVIALSGTPITNKPIEFFNVIKILEPGLFPSRWKFAHEFCEAKHNGFGWDFSGASNTSELHQLLTSTVMIRRRKEDVLKDLPPKIRTIIPLEINNIKEYKQAEGNLIAWIKQNEGKEKAEKAKQAEVLVKFEKLKQLAITGKIKQCISWIQDVVDSGQKLVVFADHKQTVNLLMEKFGKIAVKLDGSTSSINRQAAVDNFNNNAKIRLFIGSKSAKEGISLKGVSLLCFIELWWVPGFHDQAEDRIYGINRGDENTNSVNIYYLIASNTIEEDVAEIISKKQQILSQILDGKKADSSTILTTLINKIKGKMK